MKKITEMTHEERLALTYDDVLKMAKIECLEKGIQIPEAPIEPVQPVITKKGQAWKLPLVGLYFKTQEAAMAVAGALDLVSADLLQEKYDWNIDYKYKWLEQLDYDSLIQREEFYDAQEVSSMRMHLKNYKEHKEAFDKAKKEHESKQQAFNEIHQEIESLRQQACGLQSRVDCHKTRFNEYLNLSDGDERKALLFYLKAWQVQPDEKSLLNWPLEEKAEQCL